MKKDSILLLTKDNFNLWNIYRRYCIDKDGQTISNRKCKQLESLLFMK